jgi:hypothetical protein
MGAHPGGIKNVDGIQPVVILRHDNLHILAQRLHVPCAGASNRKHGSENHPPTQFSHLIEHLSWHPM